ncbi:MAG TPA: hypothetical protein PLE77_03570 [Kiritimatiellia bacterium]|nr:hypothetical protein [Kiritimatiellia bacterium]
MDDVPQMAAAEVRSENGAPGYDVRRIVRSSIVTPLLLVPIIARRKEFEHKGTKLTKIGTRGTFERVGTGLKADEDRDQRPEARYGMTSLNRR